MATAAPVERSRRAVRSLIAAAALLALAQASPARGEERIRVLLRSAPEEIVELALEAYVAGVVSGEMPRRFPPEALRAQAVAARSYALTRKIDARARNRRWDIRADVIAQVFTENANAAAREAAAATAGEVLVLGMDLVEAYFHSSCGGTTEAGLPALGRDLPYLPSVECGRCGHARGVRWEVAVPAAELGALARLGGAATAARVVERTPTGRAARVEIARGERRVTLGGADLRQRLGFARLPSLALEVRLEDHRFVFEGRGRGHGAGLCQWGAAGLAGEGLGYREILGRYYPGAEVVRMY